MRRGGARDAEVPAGESVVRSRAVNGPFRAGPGGVRAEGRALGLGESCWAERCSAAGPGATAGGQEPGRPGGGSSSQEKLTGRPP